MHFERYYYPALQLIGKSQYPLTLRQITLTGLDQSFIKSIYDEMITEEHCEINDEVILLLEKGKQYLIDNNPNPENKELHFRVLEYLKNNEVYGKKLEFVTPFLHETATYEERYELVLVIRQLKQDDYIDFNGREGVLCDKQAGVLTPVTQTGLKASITAKGKEYLNPKTAVTSHPIHNTTNNIHNSAGITIGDGNQSSIIADTILTNPTTIKETPTNKTTAQRILEGVIIAVIGGGLLAILIWYFHTNGIRH